MSKKFKPQDYFRYKKLGKRWRRPVGLQSKLRINKGGSGNLVSIGYRTAKNMRYKVDGMDVIIVYNASDLARVGNGVALIGSSVGAKKTRVIQEKSKELGIRVLNMKKIRRADKRFSSIEKKRAEKKKKKEEKKKEEKAETKDKPKENAEVAA